MRSWGSASLSVPSLPYPPSSLNGEAGEKKFIIVVLFFGVFVEKPSKWPNPPKMSTCTNMKYLSIILGCGCHPKKGGGLQEPHVCWLAGETLSHCNTSRLASYTFFFYEVLMSRGFMFWGVLVLIIINGKPTLLWALNSIFWFERRFLKNASWVIHQTW